MSPTTAAASHDPPPKTPVLTSLGGSAVLVVMVVGVVATLLVSGLLNARRVRGNEESLQYFAVEAGERIDERIQSAFSAGIAIRAAFALTPDMDAEGFSTTVNEGGLLDAFTRVSALSFSRWVPADDLSSFQQNMSTRPEGGDIHPGVEAGSGALIVDFIQPLAGNEVAVGFVVSSEDRRRTAIEGARDRGVFTASAPIDLIQDPDGPPGVLLVVPIYRGGEVHSTGPERRRNFIGVASIAVQADTALSGVLPRDSHVNLEVVDVGPVDAEVASAPSPIVQFEPALPTSDNRAVVDINVGDRRWRLTATPNERFDFGDRTDLVVLAAGLLLTTTISLLFRQQRTGRQHAEEQVAHRTLELELTNAALERADAAKSRMLSTVSHELRTPLSAITGFAELLRREDFPDSLRADLLARISRNSHTLNLLIDELLSYSHLDQVREIALEPIDLAAVLNDAIDNLQPVLDQARVVRRISKVPATLSNADAINRIATNLIVNAAKYGGEGVVIEIDLSASDGLIELSVHDNGPGIPAEAEHRIFDRFYRGEHASVIAGTGIGLSVVRDLVDQLGGSVRLAPSFRPGAHFVVRLPISDQSFPDRQPVASSSIESADL